MDEWKNIFSSGGNLDGRNVTDPAAAVAELKRLRTASEKMQPAEDQGTIRQREAVLQMQLAEKNLENIELRRQAYAAKQCMDPSISQVRCLHSCLLHTTQGGSISCRQLVKCPSDNSEQICSIEKATGKQVTWHGMLVVISKIS